MHRVNAGIFLHNVEAFTNDVTRMIVGYDAAHDTPR